MLYVTPRPARRPADLPVFSSSPPPLPPEQYVAPAGCMATPGRHRLEDRNCSAPSPVVAGLAGLAGGGVLGIRPLFRIAPSDAATRGEMPTWPAGPTAEEICSPMPPRSALGHAPAVLLGETARAATPRVRDFDCKALASYHPPWPGRGHSHCDGVGRCTVPCPPARAAVGPLLSPSLMTKDLHVAGSSRPWSPLPRVLPLAGTASGTRYPSPGWPITPKSLVGANRSLSCTVCNCSSSHLPSLLPPPPTPPLTPRGQAKRTSLNEATTVFSRL